MACLAFWCKLVKKSLAGRLYCFLYYKLQAGFSIHGLHIKQIAGITSQLVNATLQVARKLPLYFLHTLRLVILLSRVMETIRTICQTYFLPSEKDFSSCFTAFHFSGNIPCNLSDTKNSGLQQTYKL